MNRRSIPNKSNKSHCPDLTVSCPHTFGRCTSHTSPTKFYYQCAFPISSEFCLCRPHFLCVLPNFPSATQCNTMQCVYNASTTCCRCGPQKLGTIYPPLLHCTELPSFSPMIHLLVHRSHNSELQSQLPFIHYPLDFILQVRGNR